MIPSYASFGLLLLSVPLTSDWDEHVLFQQLTNGADVQPMEVERTPDVLQLEVNITSDYVVVFL